jgi:hypothetical protein
MIALPYWITSQLAIVPRPRGGDWLDDEMAALREADIDVVVSMLQEAETAELDLEREAVSAKHAGLLFINFSIPDRGVPLEKLRFEQFLADLEAQLDAGKRIDIHCRASIGRASVTSASLLIRSGVSPEDAWNLVSAARGCSVPDTPEQREWVDVNIRHTL